jgi:hypothetical protein
MVGIDVLTIVASMANRNITNITPAVARVRFELSAECGIWESATVLD